ncbi:hypothetical protein BCR36DRAFT_583930 [Piromyces finnis]|uniref:Ricin B lectin domain-containing protein n=1 Tax=Piromyces finnis TaxID=1754191 RepID=A0A1Y1V7U9_9FUNG|nr:hypothetical protein BCR36DRAFT_583930 [Piromyces finnis]|eukprot:ORX49337.1 hypothetical protein BCR36DRAFT_583930 [Piromyces finnis]
MKLYNILLCAILLLTFVSARKVKKIESNEYLLPKKVNEDGQLYIVDIKTAHHRYHLENCRYNSAKKTIYCEFAKQLNNYKYRLNIPIISESSCEFNKDTKIVEAKLWSMLNDTNVYKLNDEFKSEGRVKVLTNELYRAQHFQLITNDECVFKAEFEEASITRL